MQNMHDHIIDLSLAVNYLPACSCAFRSVFLSLALCGIHSIKLLPAFVPLCLLLVFHRAQPDVLRIFDGSGVYFSIFLSHCVAVMQELGDGWWTVWPPVYVAFSLEWPLVAGYLMWRPPLRRAQLMGYLAGACGHASVFAFVNRPDGREHRLVRVGRDLAFAGLCLVWTYVVGIYRRKLSRDSAESSSHFAVYFWPVLFIHPWVAGLYACACFAAICTQLRPAESPSQEMVQVSSFAPPLFNERQAESRKESPPVEPEGGQADPGDEELFRQAMSLTASCRSAA
jgi:hypothetical protein